MNYLSIPHYRGLKEKYSESLHGDGLYFTTDTHEIIANNASHGDNIASWDLHDGVLTLTMKSGAQQIVNFTEASETEKGLLSAADKQQLNNLQDNLDSKVDKVTGKSLILDSEIEKLAGLPNSTELTNSIANAKAAGDNAQSDLDAHKLNVSNPHQVTKSQLGLGNVTNDAQVKRAEMGVAGGVATLDGTGKVPAAQLPAYVDDVLEGTLINATTFQLAEGQQGGVQLPNVIYVDTTTNKSYRWSGTRYVTIASDLALGETSSTAYSGDKGKAATDNINKVKSTALSHIDDTAPVTYSASKVTVNYECYEGDQYGSTGTKHGADIAAASETAAGVMTAADKIQLNLIRQETLFHPIININQICPNQGQGDNKDRWLISYAIEAAWNWIKANPNRNIYLSPGLSIMFRSTNVRATNGFDGPWLVFTYTSTNFSENEFKTDSNWCRTLSEADLNYELADSQYDGFLSKTDWTRFNNATSTINSHVTNFQNPHQVTKSQIGLSNVTNDAQVKRSEMGTNNGVATLDSSGKVVTSQLPSFVDDVLEFESKTAFPATGESGKIYVSLDTNLTYRWGGTEYVEISKSLALGETSSTAYAGNKGKDTTDKLNTHLENYNNPHQVTKTQIGLGNVDNTSDLEKPISTAQQAALDEKVDKVSGKGLSTNDYTTDEKNKLAGIAAEAQVNVIESVKINGTAQTISNKEIDIPIPANLSQLTNDIYKVATSAEIIAILN